MDCVHALPLGVPIVDPLEDRADDVEDDGHLPHEEDDNDYDLLDGGGAVLAAEDEEEAHEEGADHVVGKAGTDSTAANLGLAKLELGGEAGDYGGGGGSEQDGKDGQHAGLVVGGDVDAAEVEEDVGGDGDDDGGGNPRVGCDGLWAGGI